MRRIGYGTHIRCVHYWWATRGLNVIVVTTFALCCVEKSFTYVDDSGSDWCMLVENGMLMSQAR